MYNLLNCTGANKKKEVNTLKKVMALFSALTLAAMFISTPAFAVESAEAPTSVTLADASGWQLVHTDSWYVDDYTVTEPREFAGGGVRMCFSGQDFGYSVQLMENDDVNPDDTVGSPKTVSSSDGACVEWSGVDTEIGNEELYVILSKNSTTTDLLTIKGYD